MANRPEPPTYKKAMKFCHHHLGKGCFAPHTGYDWQAWVAFVYLLEAYARGDDRGREACIKAMRELVAGIQADTDIHTTFAQAIPAVLDWCDVARIWPQLRGRLVVAIDRTVYRDDVGIEQTRIDRYPA